MYRLCLFAAAFVASCAWGAPVLLDIGQAAAESAKAPAALAGIPSFAVRSAHFNDEEAFALAVGAEATLRLPRGLNYRVVYERTERHLSGNRTWVGHLADHGKDFRV